MVGASELSGVFSSDTSQRMLRQSAKTDEQEDR